MLYVLGRKYSRVVASLESNGLQKARGLSSGSNALHLKPKLGLTSQVTPENQHECIAEVVTPLLPIPYLKQLEIKLKWCQQVLLNFRNKLKKEMKKGTRLNMNFKLEPVKPSPITESYRNKDEFSIGMGVDGNPKTVGFFVGSPADGPVVCVGGAHLINLRPSHKAIAQAFEDYIRSSPLPACHDFRAGGHWRNLVVRSNEDDEVMAIVQFHPQDMEHEKLEAEADKLREYFGSSGRHLSSFYFQPCRHSRCTADQAPYKLLLGEPHLVEKLGNFKFRISPDSFFQVNTAAASVMYDTALALGGLGPMTTLLDVCCGTGTVSILASQNVRGAIGIESVCSAVADARRNAELNDVDNVEFIHGLAEKKIPNVISELGMASEIVVVFNPGRSGLHGRVVKSACACPQIRRVVYISCKADNPNTMSNFVQLCSEGNFALKQVVPVDIFPHTHHIELVMLFER